MAANPLFHRVARALFRLHVENGFAVALGMLVVGSGFYIAFGLPVTVLAYTGALCASIVDQPSRFSIKPPIFAGAVLATSAISFLAALAASSPLLLMLLVAALSFGSALISAYGRRALGLGVAAVLALVLGMTGQTQSVAEAFQHTTIFAAGGVAYALFALATGALLDDRNRRVVLGEALRAFAAYLHAKAAVFDPGETHRPALRGLIEAHGVLSENLQIARDMIFARPNTARRARYVAVLLALLDCFEQILSASADIEILRRSQHRHLLRRLRALTAYFADDTERLITALAARSLAKPPAYKSQLDAIGSEIARLERTPSASPEEEVARAAFESTTAKLARAAAQLERLFAAVLDAAPVSAPPKALDLATFMQQETTNPRVLLAQFTFGSPTLRYAIRLTLAMVAGCAITLLFPDYVHGGWILLTTALIMRANYSITRQRRNDRIVGTLAGCVIAAALIHVLPGVWPLLGIVVGVGVSHAFGAVNYRVTALAASVSALLLIHFLSPAVQPLFFERVVDTLIGSALATAFSFLLPSWERRNLPALLESVIRSGRSFAEQSLRRTPDDQAYRLARRAALDSVTALASAARRLLDEPQADRRTLATLNQLLSASYLFASDLASVRTALQARAAALEPAAADAALAAARDTVLDALVADRMARGERPDKLGRRSLSEMPAAHALPFLRRRLINAERSARNVALLAKRVVAPAP